MAEQSDLYRAFLQISLVESALREQVKRGEPMTVHTAAHESWLVRLDEAMRLLQPLVPEFREVDIDDAKPSTRAQDEIGRQAFIDRETGRQGGNA